MTRDDSQKAFAVAFAEQSQLMPKSKFVLVADNTVMDQMQLSIVAAERMQVVGIVAAAMRGKARMPDDNKASLMG